MTTTICIKICSRKNWIHQGLLIRSSLNRPVFPRHLFALN